MGNNFNVIEYMKEPRIQEGAKSELKNHKIVMELDPACDISEKNGWGKGISSKLLPKLQMGPGVKELVTEEIPKAEETRKESRENVGKSREFRKRKRKFVSIGKSGVFPKVDQGLQTEDLLSSESRKRVNHQTKHSMYEIQDNFSECSISNN